MFISLHKIMQKCYLSGPNSLSIDVLFKQLTRVPFVVTGNQLVRVVHGGWVHCKPIDDSHGFAGMAVKYVELRDNVVSVVLIPEIVKKLVSSIKIA